MMIPSAAHVIALPVAAAIVAVFVAIAVVIVVCNPEYAAEVHEAH